MSLDALKLADGTYPRNVPAALMEAVEENDYDIAHGNAVTGPQLDWLEAHDYPLPVSVAASGMPDSDITALRLAFEGPA